VAAAGIGSNEMMSPFEPGLSSQHLGILTVVGSNVEHAVDLVLLEQAAQVHWFPHLIKFSDVEQPHAAQLPVRLFELVYNTRHTHRTTPFENRRPDQSVARFHAWLDCHVRPVVRQCISRQKRQNGPLILLQR
jgi:hypothetical protein